MLIVVVDGRLIKDRGVLRWLRPPVNERLWPHD